MPRSRRSSPNARRRGNRRDFAEADRIRAELADRGIISKIQATAGFVGNVSENASVQSVCKALPSGSRAPYFGVD